MSPRVLFWLPAAVRMAFIFFVSLVSGLIWGALVAVLVSSALLLILIIIQLNYFIADRFAGCISAYRRHSNRIDCISVSIILFDQKHTGC